MHTCASLGSRSRRLPQSQRRRLTVNSGYGSHLSVRYRGEPGLFVAKTNGRGDSPSRIVEFPSAFHRPRRSLGKGDRKFVVCGMGLPLIPPSPVCHQFSAIYWVFAGRSDPCPAQTPPQSRVDRPPHCFTFSLTGSSHLDPLDGLHYPPNTMPSCACAQHMSALERLLHR